MNEASRETQDITEETELLLRLDAEQRRGYLEVEAPYHRQMLKMTETYGNSEVARRIGVTESSVRSKRARAGRRLAERDAMIRNGSVG